MSKVLFDSKPITVAVELATLVGLNEAIVLQQVHYWKVINDTKKEREQNLKDGYIWTYNTIEEWCEEFPFWSESTVNRTFKKLKKQGLLITGNYNKKGYDRTLWYRIDYEKLEQLQDNAKKEKELKIIENTHNVKMTISESNSLCQNDNMDNVKMTTSPCQNDNMDNVKMTTPIPKITPKITSKTTTERKESSSSSSERKDKFLNSIKAEMQEQPFNNFIKKLDIEELENKIILTSPDAVTKTIVENKFSDLIKIHLKKYYDFDSLDFRI